MIKMAKVDIISGFLGAGKTTLIKKLLAGQLKNEKVVLIENEFGDVGIDGTFLKEAGIEIKEINSGCICCSLVGDFREALKKVMEEYEPERLIIEPSGVGKLSDIEEAVKDVGLDVHALVTVADVNKIKVYHRNFGEFFDNQIENAQIIIFSRTQKANDEKVEEMGHLVHELNPDSKCIIAPWDDLSDEQILKVMDSFHHHEHDENCTCGCHDHEHHHHDEEHEHHHDEECECGHEHHHHHDEECECGHEHHHEHDENCTCGCHDHDHHHHGDEEFTSVAYESAHSYTKEELQGMLEQLDEHILRAKGMVKSKDGWLFFDYVPEEIDIREGQVQPIGQIVVIGSKVNEKEIKELFKVV